MQDGSLPQSLEQALRITRIIVAAMIGGVVMLAGMAAFVAGQAERQAPAPAPTSPAQEIFYLAALALVVGSVAVRRLMTSGRGLAAPMSAEELARRFQQAHIVGAALAEIPAWLGLVYFLLFDPRLSTLGSFAGVSLLALLTCLPSRFQLEDLLELCVPEEHAKRD